MRMSRNQAVAVADAVENLVQGATRGELFPKIGVVISDNAIVFWTTRQSAWAGVDPATVVANIKQTAKLLGEAPDKFLKAAGEETKQVLIDRSPGRVEMNHSRKYPWILPYMYAWHFNHGLDDNAKALLAAHAKKMGMKVTDGVDA